MNETNAPKHHHPPKNQWRTVLACFFLAVGLIVSELLLRNSGEIGEKMHASTSWAYIVMLTVVAGKALGEHVSGNGGLANLVKGVLGGSPAPETKPVERGAKDGV